MGSTEFDLYYHYPIKYFNISYGDWRGGDWVDSLKFDP